MLFKRWNVATVLTVYGIETRLYISDTLKVLIVATVLTVYGIETSNKPIKLKSALRCNSTYRLRY